MIGRRIDRYEIVAELGRGGMGVVYRARDTLLGRVVALKLLPPDKQADPERRSRFLREAKATSALNHPGIVAVHDVLDFEGRNVIVMEWVDGETLQQKLAHGPVSLADALRWSVEISDAVARAHAAGIVHRDLKPSNVMVTAEGRAKILDFGLAKLVERPRCTGPEEETATAELPRPGTAVTQRGVFLGTVDYASPEQIEAAGIDGRSDVFAFGVLVYELLTRHHPFRRGSSLETLTAIREETPVSPSRFVPELPAPVERAVLRCLNKEPGRRWQDMADLKSVLEDAREDSESGRRPAVAKPGSDRRRRRLWAVAVVVVVIGVALAGWVVLRPRAPAVAALLELHRLTHDSGLSAFPSISADGKLVVFSSDRGGGEQFDLWVLHVNRPEPVRLTHHPSSDTQPCLSPDASRVVFRSERDGGGVFIMDTLGGQERRIAAGGMFPRFSPDGSQILFVEQPGWAPSGLHRMFLVSPERGSPGPFAPRFGVQRPPASAGPVWSPDGRRVLFKGAPLDDPARIDWWVAPLDGGEPVPSGAVERLPQRGVMQFPWAWFGDRMLFLAGTTIDGVNLFSATISPEGQISGPPEQLTAGSEISFSPSVSAEGRVALSNFNWIMHFWEVDIDADSGRARGQPRRITTDATSKFDFSVSRDGSTLAYSAFTGSRGTGRTELRLRDLRGGGESVLFSTSSFSFTQLPRLSRDAALLSWGEMVEDETVVFVAPTGEPTGRELCRQCFVLGFFSDGSPLIRERPTRLVRQDLQDATQTPLVELDDGAILDADLSPDDRWLAMRVGRADRSVGLYITSLEQEPAPVTEWIELDVEAPWLGSPRWSSDGRRLYYLSQQDDFICIWALPLDPGTKRPAGEPFAVVHLHGNPMSTSGPSRNWWNLGLTGNRLVFNAAETRGNVYTAQLPSD